MAHLITGAKGQAHITPKSDAVWHRGLMGVESCILDYGEKLAPALIPSQPTNIRILDGCGMMQGRFFEIEEGSYDTIAIPNGAQGYNRIDIVCAKITQNENGTQTFSWEVVQGTQTTETPTPPTVEEHSLDDGDEFALMPIASVELEGVSIVAVETVAEIGQTIERLKSVISSIQTSVRNLSLYASAEAGTRQNLTNAYATYPMRTIYCPTPGDITLTGNGYCALNVNGGYTVSVSANFEVVTAGNTQIELVSWSSGTETVLGVATLSTSGGWAFLTIPQKFTNAQGSSIGLKVRNTSGVGAITHAEMFIKKL